MQPEQVYAILESLPEDTELYVLRDYKHAFNITAAKAMVQGRGPNCRFEIRDWREHTPEYPWNEELTLDQMSWAMKYADCDDPVIICQALDGGYGVIDGKHRVFRAWAEKREFIFAHLLTPWETDLITLW